MHAGDWNSGRHVCAEKHSAANLIHNVPSCDLRKSSGSSVYSILGEDTM